MYNVINYETTEIQCECASYSHAIKIATALNAQDGERFAVRYGDEIRWDTRDGSVF